MEGWFSAESMIGMQHRSETRDGMRIDWNVPITMDDGLVLRADVFRPISDWKFPVILSYGPYAKGLSFRMATEPMAVHDRRAPRRGAGSSNKYQNWEVVDPKKWVPDGYVCVRVDSRGCGCSPGYIDHFSPRETSDFYNCIEWAGIQPWGNGKSVSTASRIMRSTSGTWRRYSRRTLRRCASVKGRRLVPRHDTPRRHSLHLLGELVRHGR